MALVWGSCRASFMLKGRTFSSKWLFREATDYIASNSLTAPKIASVTAGPTLALQEEEQDCTLHAERHR